VRITTQLIEAMLPAIRQRVVGQAPTTARTEPAAYSLYLQGLHFYLQRTVAGLDLAVEYALRAVEIDPAYAPCWTLLASAYINQVNLGKRPRDEGFRLAGAAIDEDQHVFGIRTEPFLRVLHGDPRWEPTLEKLGLGERQVADIVL